MLTVKLCDGKYTVIQLDDGRLYADRNGQPWRDLTGDGLVLALTQRVAELEQLQKGITP